MPEIPFDRFVLYLAAIVAPVFTAGAAWAAVKGALNGVRSDVREIKKATEQLLASDSNQNERLARIEEQAENRRGWIRRVEDAVKEAKEIAEAKS